MMTNNAGKIVLLKLVIVLMTTKPVGLTVWVFLKNAQIVGMKTNNVGMIVLVFLHAIVLRTTTLVGMNVMVFLQHA